MISKKQEPSKTVDDYLQEMQRLGRYLNKSDADIKDVIVCGLQPEIKKFVKQQECTTLDQVISKAKLGEMSVPPSTQSETNPQISALEQQLKCLTDQLAALTANIAPISTQHRHQHTGRGNFSHRGQENHNRQYKNNGYAQQTHTPGQSSWRSNNTQSKPRDECHRCGSSRHIQQRCPSHNLACHHCGNRGHFARRCRSARFQGQ